MSWIFLKKAAVQVLEVESMTAAELIYEMKNSLVWHKTFLVAKFQNLTESK